MMIDQMVRSMQLIGSLLAVGIGSLAVVWYVVLWPFDRMLR